MGRILNFASDYDGDLFNHADGSPRLWWYKEAYWQEREYVTSINRPVEDTALLNIWLEARALRHLNHYRFSLQDYEERILTLELRCLRENPHYSAGMRHEWIAGRMNGAHYQPRQVRAILQDVSDILRRAEMIRVLDTIEQAERRRSTYFREVVREVIREQCRKAA